MLSVKFICVGRMRERFYIEAFNEYAKRLQSYCKLQLVEPAEIRLGDDPSDKEIIAALDKEAEGILAAIPDGSYVVALCVEGKGLPSEAIGELIAQRENSGKPRLCFIIGGSYGQIGRASCRERV